MKLKIADLWFPLIVMKIILFGADLQEKTFNQLKIPRVISGIY